MYYHYNVSFLLQKIIFKSQQQQQQPQNANTTASVDVNTTTSTQSDLVIRGFSEQGELLSLNHHLYTLLRTNRSYRRAFSQQLLKMFDDSYSHKTSLAHMLYISDNLAYFPYQLIDEPLYLIHQIDIIISVTGINLLQTFKESLLNHRSTAEKTETQPQTQSEENIQAGDVDVNQDCPIEVDETGEENAVLNSNGDKINCENANLNPSQKKAALQEDDEDETYDTVFNNLPPDLKTLKDCMYKAQGCCLLLILKMFFKEVYSITDR
jgi:cohesin loading factor subunit SCC2